MNLACNIFFIVVDLCPSRSMGEGNPFSYDDENFTLPGYTSSAFTHRHSHLSYRKFIIFSRLTSHGTISIPEADMKLLQSSAE